MSRITLIILTILFLSACSETDPRLMHCNILANTTPETALAALDSIDATTLSEHNRHYRNLLIVKASDKAYITHTDDSLIVSVLDYFSKHDQDSIYTEALYYGGRVYSDLGDAPRALDHFQKALERLQKNDCLYLKGAILSQYSRLLTFQHLYSEAIPLLEKAIELDSQLLDSLNYIYDIQLLGEIYFLNKNYKSSEKCFKSTFSLHSKKFPVDTIYSKMYIAAIKSKENQLDSALFYIQNITQNIDPLLLNNALAIASNIYLKAGMLDSAYKYSYQLINRPNRHNKDIGYHILLSPSLRHYINKDSLDTYFYDFEDLLVEYYDDNESQLFRQQQNAYNYQIHEREKIIAQENANNLLFWIRLSFVALLILIIFILFLKNRNKSNIIKLNNAIKKINDLKSEIQDLSIKKELENPTTNIQSSKLKEDALRNQLKEQLRVLAETSTNKYTVSSIISDSEVYIKIQNSIKENKILNESDPLWNEIENIVREESPNFKSNLLLLTSGKLSTIDYQTALLIKCGIRPSQMVILLAKSNGAIISRRESLSFKIFGERLNIKTIDSIIRLL